MTALGLLLTKSNKAKVKQTIPVELWLTSLEQLDLITFIKLKRCLAYNTDNLNYDINATGILDTDDHDAFIDFLVKGTVPARFLGGLV